MTSLVDIPILSITSQTSESAVNLIRGILRAECRYSGLSPSVLTISSRLTVADGGIDAEINTPASAIIPTDCLFMSGLTGFQIKSGTSFKPWTASAIQAELLNSKGELFSEVERLAQQSGRYTLICTGHDLTPEQRNEARDHIARVFSERGHAGYEDRIEILGARQIAEFVERYPSIASSIAPDPIQEAWVLDVWRQDAHMSNPFEVSNEQSELIQKIRAGLFGVTKHIRVLGEPGLGKTRIVLEAVSDPDLAPCVLYFPHGSQFGQTKLFRHLLRSACDKPLILIIDELPESELSELWRHLKTRCGTLKIVSLDHGHDETRDEDIERLYAPKLSDETIKQILIRRVGDSRELHRWVEICEGSPRVAQAVAENLRANPEDLLRPPTTVPLWERFLHGYGRRDEQQARQVDCVTQHLALFNRFGYEAPVSDEARYIARVIESVDSTIGTARFHEIVRDLRRRRVLQGSKTLFFVPRALHIFLWKKFWESYGRDFQFMDIFEAMPESLHVWFMNMFKYAGDAATTHVVEDILRPDGIYSNRQVFTSAKGGRFLSTLAEANPAAVLRLLEATIGRWSDEELLDFTEDRQSIVWTLEKIAVWTPQVVRALRLLGRLAVNENAKNGNNATGTLIGLFRIGPEYAATEATPTQRMPALLELLRSDSDAKRELGLHCMAAALDTSGMGMRIIGPEYQGMKERAKLWIPKTYGEWWDAHHTYFQALIKETNTWPEHLRPKVCSALLDAVRGIIKIPPCTEPALATLEMLAHDPHMNPSKINKLFSDWGEYHDEEGAEEITKRIDAISRAYVRRDIRSRFQRYVIDIDWLTWDEERRERRGKPKNHAKALVNALAKRVIRQRELFDAILPMFTPQGTAPALWHFGQELAKNDTGRELLPRLLAKTLEAKHWGCLIGYLDQLRNTDSSAYHETIHSLLSGSDTAWLGAELGLRLGYDKQIFGECLDALESGWIEPTQFSILRWGRALESVSVGHFARLLQYLHGVSDEVSLGVLIDLLEGLPFEEPSPFSPDLVFDALTHSLPNADQGPSVIDKYEWSQVGKKFIAWKPDYRLPLLDALLTKIGECYRLSYDSYIAPFASDLAEADPAGAWRVIRQHFEQTLPKWRGDLQHWLKGGIGGFDEGEARGPIADLPLDDILAWVAKDPEQRAALIAHAAPGTLDDERGGRLTRELLARYPTIDGVKNGIWATFHSGGWTGPESEHLKRRRDKFRRWLSADFHYEVIQWIELELEYLDKRIERAEIEEERERFD